MWWFMSWRSAAAAVLCFCTQGLAQSGAPTTRTIFISALTPNDSAVAESTQLSSHVLNPAFVAIHQGDAVRLVGFVVNREDHDVRLLDPDGVEVLPMTIWHRGRQYELSFVAKKTGSYRLICSLHAPAMTATFLVAPRL